MNVNANENAVDESVPVPIGANANTNVIELTKGFDVPSQIRVKKDIPPFAFAYRLLHISWNLSLAVCECEWGYVFWGWGVSSVG